MKEDLTALIQELERQNPTLQFYVTSPIGEDDELVAAIAEWVVRQHR